MTTTDDQSLWGAGYVNDLALRDEVVNTSETVWIDNNGSISTTTTPGGATTRLYVQQDANYNVTAITDDSGPVQERFAYDPYGNQQVLNSSWSSTSDAYNWIYAFQGGRTDTATGLIRFGARDYNPNDGRWIEPDPAGYVDGVNDYQALHDDPIDMVDCGGLDATPAKISTKYTEEPGIGAGLTLRYSVEYTTSDPKPYIWVQHVASLYTAFGKDGKVVASTSADIQEFQPIDKDHSVVDSIGHAPTAAYVEHLAALSGIPICRISLRRKFITQFFNGATFLLGSDRKTAIPTTFDPATMFSTGNGPEGAKDLGDNLMTTQQTSHFVTKFGAKVIEDSWVTSPFHTDEPSTKNYRIYGVSGVGDPVATIEHSDFAMFPYDDAGFTTYSLARDYLGGGLAFSI